MEKDSQMETEALITTEILKKDLEHLKQWLSKNPHLPKIEDDWIITFLHHNKYSLEKTKTKIDNYYSFRNKYPHILKNRDPTGPEILQAEASYYANFADRLTKDGQRVIFGQPKPDTSLWDMNIFSKRFFMMIDLIYLEKDRHSYISAVTDCQHLSYMHFLKALPGFRSGVDIFLNAYSDRVKALHFINVPFGDKAINAGKAFFPKKIADRFFVHSSTEDLFKHIDETVVCSDLGGKGPSLAEYAEYTSKLMEKHKEWYRQQNYVCTNEEFRRIPDGKIEEMKGSFRKLEVD